MVLERKHAPKAIDERNSPVAYNVPLASLDTSTPYSYIQKKSNSNVTEKIPQVFAYKQSELNIN